MLYIIDTYAWVEYFEGSKKGQELHKLLLSNKNSFITIESCIAELYNWALNNNLIFGELLKIVRANSDITPVILGNWTNAASIRRGKRKAMKNFGIMDALLIAKQRELNCMIITGDKHFKGLKNITYIG